MAIYHDRGIHQLERLALVEGYIKTFFSFAEPPDITYAETFRQFVKNDPHLNDYARTYILTATIGSLG